MSAPQPPPPNRPPPLAPNPTSRPTPPACPACGGSLVEIRAKLICSRCRRICETCCEGGPG